MSLGESSEAASVHVKFQRRLAQKVRFQFSQKHIYSGATAFVHLCCWKLLLIITLVQVSMFMLLRKLWHFDSLVSHIKAKGENFKYVYIEDIIK